MTSENVDATKGSFAQNVVATEGSVAPVAPKTNEAKEEIQPKKNPKRVADGKGVEARMLKAKIKRKEEELLRKENIALKENSFAPLTKKQTTKDDETLNTDYALQSNPIDKQNSDKDSNKNYKLLCLSIGIVGLGLYIFNQRKQSQASEASSALRTPSNHKRQKIVVQKKEIDPFEF